MLEEGLLVYGVSFSRRTASVWGWWDGFGGRGLTYPCVVELCLHADQLALLLILCPQDLELCWVER